MWAQVLQSTIIQDGTQPSRNSVSSLRTSSALSAFAIASLIRIFSSAVISLPDAPGMNVLAISPVAPFTEAAVVCVAESVVARDVGSLSGVRNKVCAWDLS